MLWWRWATANGIAGLVVAKQLDYATSCRTNSNASKVFVYFNVDNEVISTSTGTNAGTGTDSASVSGSVFTTGYLFLSGGIGLLLGAGIMALIFFAAKPKKKEEKAE